MLSISEIETRVSRDEVDPLPAPLPPVRIAVMNQNLLARANLPQRQTNDAQLAVVVNRFQLCGRRLELSV